MVELLEGELGHTDGWHEYTYTGMVCMCQWSKYTPGELLYYADKICFSVPDV